MIVRFRCPSCGAQYRVDEEKVAKVKAVTCKKCQTRFQWRETLFSSVAESSEPQESSGEIFKQRYQIKRLLGEGGMGTTYQAIDLHTQGLVTLKVLQLSRAKEWKTVEMFEREAKILQQLKHPQIPAYIEYFSLETESEIKFVLVQEYIEGKTLQQMVEEGWQASEQAALAIVRQLADILNYLHTLRPPVIHRGINPKNIILTQFPYREGIGEGSAYLVDFGAVEEKIRTTFFGGSTVVGTCGYAPFEQFNGKAVPASDYYALGGTLLYVLTQKHPAKRPASRTLTRLRRVGKDKFYHS